MKVKNKSIVLEIVLLCGVLVSYGLLFCVFSSPWILRSIYTGFFLAVAALYDIRTKKIPVAICLGTGLTGLFYSLLYSWDIRVYIAGAIVFFVFFIIHFINRSIIGMGDILLLGFSVLSLSMDHIYIFLFLSFFFSLIWGLIEAIKGHRMKDITIPMAPCIALSYVVITMGFFL